MKYISIISCLMVLFTSCKSPYFTSANSMRNISGTIYLKDGKELNGPISSALENYSGSKGYIEYSGNTDNKASRVPVSEIKGISVRNNYYEPKLIDMGFGSRDQVLFVKKMTKDNSRINLYELYERQTNTSSSNRRSYETESYTYYITLPGQSEEAWNIEGRHLTPNFENKMSELVKDCPLLAEKIRRKDKGYFYAQVSLVQEKRIETLMNIIDEYNKCR
ncbi:MAG TPA: hypothetical protein VK498_09315 [Ferruginibacter sp.]|nr:hypothetical protein [Ferruginibacter sp.]